MTKKHRDRVLLAGALVVAVAVALSAPVAASSGALAGLGIAAVTVVPALLLLGVVAFVTRAKDTDKTAFDVLSPQRTASVREEAGRRPRSRPSAEGDTSHER
ncbi:MULTISPECIES: hypothetical protein [unclassified Microbacterium]|uniref:hypothetical protein n=1 Tax=unclassified Microbacterium TaxID=2609290 RepID=UPI003869E4F6